MAKRQIVVKKRGVNARKPKAMYLIIAERRNRHWGQTPFTNICEKITCSYGDGHASERIANKTVEIVLEEKIDLKKRFYDINL